MMACPNIHRQLPGLALLLSSGVLKGRWSAPYTCSAHRHHTQAAVESTSSGGLLPVPVLGEYSINGFRDVCLALARPVLIPQRVCPPIPASSRWFLKSQDPQDGESLRPDSEYLLGFGDPLVPLELTRSPPNPAHDSEAAFQRFHGPLSLFLKWIVSATSADRDRLYLAQAPVSDLARELQADLPAPELVHAGRGDIYNTNLWMGLTPTYTPLHRDPNPNLFRQMAGKKRVRLYEPDAGTMIFHLVQRQLGRVAHATIRGEEMMQGPERKALEEAVWTDQAPTSEMGLERYEVSMQQGDMLFIPQGWWHSIKSVGEGFNASVNWWFR